MSNGPGSRRRTASKTGGSLVTWLGQHGLGRGMLRQVASLAQAFDENAVDDAAGIQDLRVGQRVKNGGAFTPGPNYSVQTHQCQVLRHGRGARSELKSKLIDGAFAFAEQPHDLQ